MIDGYRNNVKDNTEITNKLFLPRKARCSVFFVIDSICFHIPAIVDFSVQEGMSYHQEPTIYTRFLR